LAKILGKSPWYHSKISHALCNSPMTTCPLIRKLITYTVVWRRVEVLVPKTGARLPER